MIVDVIMLSKGDTPNKRQMTQNAINSIHASEFHHTFNIVVVETMPNVVYKNCVNIHPNEIFHYNKFTKIGYAKCDQSDYILFVNNDIRAHHDFVSEMLKGLEAGYHSVSPTCPRINEHRTLQGEFLEGFSIWSPARFCGWAFMMKKATVESIGLSKLFPNELHGWYSDNWVCEIMKNNGLKHALVKNAKLEHFQSMTLKSLDKEENIFYTTGQKEAFDDLLASFDDNL